MNALLDAFVWPLALSALIAVPLAALLARHEVLRRHAARAMLGGPTSGAHRDLAHLAGAALLVGAIALAALAFARPRWGSREIPLEQRGVDVVIVLDVSRSMLAQDVTPSRAQASAIAIGELLTHLQGNRVGLVTFAGSTFPRSPLTLDTDALRALVQRAQAESTLVRPGTDLGGAVTAALGLLDVDDRASTQVVLVVTDGEVQQADITAVGAAASQARSHRVRVFGAFAATETPTALPASSGGTDVTRGQRAPLDALAERTGAEVRDIGQAPGFAVEFRRLQQTRFEERSQEVSVERFPWFAGAALALVILQLLLPQPSTARPSRQRRVRWSPLRLRRRAMPTMALLLLLLPGCASILGTPVYRAVAEGNRLYATGKYEEALAAYDRARTADPGSPAIAYDRGLALHRLARYYESYQATVDALNEATDVQLAGRMEFSAGNSAVMAEQWTDARDRYIDALRLDPGDAAAKANLELVLSHTAPGQQPGEGETPQNGNSEPPPPADGQQGDAPQQQPGQGSGQAGEPQQPADGQPGQPGQPTQPGAPDDGASPATDATTFAEAQAALEAALGALGPEVSREEALRILELARQANSFGRPSRSTPQDGGPPPPR